MNKTTTARQIQWFPGHMTKARRMIEDNIDQVDAVCEILDSRIPYSSHIPDLDELTSGRPRLVVLNRMDQAAPSATRQWAAFYRALGFGVLETDSKTGKGVSLFPGAVRRIMHERIEKWNEKGQCGRAIKVLIIGIPNVGKSSFINRVSGRRAAESSDRPGVTKGKQWISVDKRLLLLDTPGILWPKFENPKTGENLARCGSIRDGITDTVELAAGLLIQLRERNPEGIRERLKFDPSEEMSGHDMLELAAKKRGFLITGGECDLERTSAVIIDEFRATKFGRVTLELPEDI